MIRVFVVDDHDLVRRGLRAYLGTIPDIEIVGEAPDVQRTWDGIAALAGNGGPPDIVLLDLVLLDDDGSTLIGPLRERYPQTRVVVLTGFADRSSAQGALDLGVAGFVRKESAVDEIESAIRAAVVGGRHLDVLPAGEDPVLTAREFEVAGQVARGLSNRQIARRLDISERTVQTHLTNIMRKLGMTSRTQVAVWATEHN